MTKVERDELILVLFSQGIKSRAIALRVLGDESKKSTVNDVLKRHRDSKLRIVLEPAVKSKLGVADAVKGVVEARKASRSAAFVQAYGTQGNTFRIQTTTGDIPDGCNHFVLPDVQAKPDSDKEFLRWVGEYIVERRAEVLVCLGDFGDLPSLSSYDMGKKSSEGRRLNEDIDATIEAMRILLQPLYDLQQEELKQYGEVRYKPKMVLTLGNHEDRITRHVNANAELHGFVSTDNLCYSDFGWEVIPFLKPAVVNGVGYVHFAANPFSSKPYGGSAMNILQKVGTSMTVGHKQTLDIATRNLPTTGQQQWFICAGACYTDDEDYKGPQGNYHWRGVIVKHNVVNGGYSPMFVDLDYLEKKFG